MGGDNNYQSYSNAASSYEQASEAVFVNAPRGPLGVDPLQFSVILFALLVLYVFYLLLPRALRKQYFGAYPKRHAWSARSRRRNFGASSVASSSLATATTGMNTRGMHTVSTQASTNNNMLGLDPHHHHYGGGGGAVHGQLHGGPHSSHLQQQHQQQQLMYGSNPHVTQAMGVGAHHGVGIGGVAAPFDDEAAWQTSGGVVDPHLAHLHATSLQQQQHPNDEIVVSAAMQQLRDPGVLIVAHGSRGKPKTVRLQLTETAITWRTETRKKSSSVPKLGKLHQVPLSHIMYVDVGKQTTALRRVENAQVSEALCFSLLTKEGSLDLEANSPRERDALVSCFSLVLDEVHAQNWRDIYRGPSSDMPSSFDELDANNNGGGGEAKV